MFVNPVNPREPFPWVDARYFVVKEHHASQRHWDLRLERAGRLKSFVLPKGPSLDPRVTRLAVPVGDHSLKYLRRTGTIPQGQYGAGKVYPYAEGIYLVHEPDFWAAWNRGELHLTFYGTVLNGDWQLSRMSSGGSPRWLLRKCADRYALPGHTAEVLGRNGRQVTMPPNPSRQILLPFTD